MALLLVSCGPPDLARLTVDAPTGQIARALSQCDLGGLGDMEDPRAGLADIGGWIKVTEFVEGDIDWLTVRVDPAMSVGLVAKAVRDGQASLRSHDDNGDEISWAIRAGADVWLGTRDFGGRWPPVVSDTIVLLPDGRSFFAGECAQEFAHGALVTSYGEAADSKVASFVGELPVDVEHDDMMPETRRRRAEIIEPANIAWERLLSMPVALLHFSLEMPVVWSLPVCTRVSLGWNKCIEIYEEGGSHVVTSAYLDGSPIEIWLVGASGEPTHPIRLLGTVDIPSELDSEDLAIRLDIVPDPAAKWLAGQAVMVDLAEIRPLADVDFQDPDWPGLSGPQDGEWPWGE